MAKVFKCKVKCGLCCIVSTEIYLSIDEVEAGKYKMQKQCHDPGGTGWGDKSLKKVKKFIPELGAKTYCCFYFEPKTKSCLIYDDRPYTCRQFNCNSCSSEKGFSFQEIWAAVLAGEKTIDLDGIRRINE